MNIRKLKAKIKEVKLIAKLDISNQYPDRKYRIEEWLVRLLGNGLARKKAMDLICEKWDMSYHTLKRYRYAKCEEKHLELSYQRLDWLKDFLLLPSIDMLVTDVQDL